jgi:hypothetical protein
MALDAAAAGEYERFHDLAWRTIQTGPKNDPVLMFLLARAQSLSGRPGDALVMLQRLAAMGVTTDAATNDDFRRVRNLPGWAEFEKPGAAAEKTDLKVGEKAGLKAGTTEGAAAARTDTRAADAGDTVRFETLPFTPAGLAYDAVSRRFIIGDRRARRLAVVDEFSRHVANLASAQSAGFGDIAAIEIDPRQGDLWVISGDGTHATVHKLQLVSGRALGSYAPPERFGEVDFVDVAAAPDTGALVLDRAGHRIFQLRPKSAALELALTLPDDRPMAIAPAGNGVVYVAHAAGLSRVDLAAHSITELRPARGVDLENITKLRWHNGALIAVHREDDGAYRAVRLRLDRQGRGIAAIAPLGASLASADPTAIAVAGGTLYYLAATDQSAMTLRKVPLK